MSSHIIIKNLQSFFFTLLFLHEIYNPLLTGSKAKACEHYLRTIFNHHMDVP